MQNVLDQNPDLRMSPWLMILLLIISSIIGLFAFNSVSIILLLPTFEFDYELLQEAFIYPAEHPEARLQILIAQGITSFGAFFLAPVILLKVFLKMPVRSFFGWPKPMGLSILTTIIITFSFMVINSIVVDWNQHIELPSFMSWFEQQAKSKEIQLQQLTEFLTNFDGFFQFLVGMVVIAIVPSIGEEFLFRGLLQNMFHRGFGNAHVAIWLTALLFGAFHFQFYGAFPRMLLGVLFGYLYYWSGHLSLAMLGHFVNNGFTLITLYLNSQGVIDYNITGEPELPPTSLLLLFGGICGVLLFVFRNFYQVEESNE